MNCLVYACQEKPAFITQLGLVCNTHSAMMSESISGKLIKYCIECKSKECNHITQDVQNVPPSEKLTDDGKPETLGVNVGERIKSGEAMG